MHVPLVHQARCHTHALGPQHVFPDSCQWRAEKETPIGCQEHISAERTQNKNPAQYLLTIEQMVEYDYPVPSYLADVFQKPEGWIDTPQVAAKPEGSHTVYAIDCEMVAWQMTARH
jgi:hypothetical protein